MKTTRITTIKVVTLAVVYFAAGLILTNCWNLGCSRKAAIKPKRDIVRARDLLGRVKPSSGWPKKKLWVTL